MEDIRPKPEPGETTEQADLRLEEQHRDRVFAEMSAQLDAAYRAVSNLLESQTHPTKKNIQ